MITLLQEAKPRRIPLGLDTRKILSFTDGAWERGTAGLGAVLIDETSGQSLVVQDQVVGDHLICQIELFAVVLVRWEFRAAVANKRVILFIDNNSARGGLLKGRSSSPTMDDLLKAFCAAEVNSPAFWWVERVPSKSNPADEPSRGLGAEAASQWHAKLWTHFLVKTRWSNGW